MNIVLIVTIGLLLFGALNGLRKGLIKTVFSTFALIAALVIAGFCGPYAAKFLKTTVVYDQLFYKVETSVESILMQDAGIRQDSAVIGDMIPQSEMLNSAFDDIGEQIEAINKLPFPDQIKNGLLDNNNYQIYDILGINKFVQYIANYICMLVINAIAYVGVFIISYIILKLIGLLMDGFSELPVLNGLNRTGGLILGMANGVMAIWFMFIVITLFCTSEWGTEAFRQINENVILSYIYNHNYLLSIIKNIGVLIF